MILSERNYRLISGPSILEWRGAFIRAGLVERSETIPFNIPPFGILPKSLVTYSQSLGSANLVIGLFLTIRASGLSPIQAISYLTRNDPNSDLERALSELFIHNTPISTSKLFDLAEKSDDPIFSVVAESSARLQLLTNLGVLIVHLFQPDKSIRLKFIGNDSSVIFGLNLPPAPDDIVGFIGRAKQLTRRISGISTDTLSQLQSKIKVYNDMLSVAGALDPSYLDAARMHAGLNDPHVLLLFANLRSELQGVMHLVAQNPNL